MAKGSKKKKITLAEFNGDHGTGTQAAKSGTILEEVKAEDGSNPNRRARRIRVERIEDMVKRKQITMRQYQAAREIRDAWCGVQMLSSGGEIKERVQSSPKPDATVSRQVAAMSRYKLAMDAVPSAMRYVVEHVCWHNEPVNRLKGPLHSGSHMANLKVALELVANRLRY